MKVKELVEILSKMPNDALVLVDGYEGGLSEVVIPKLTQVELNVHTEDYNGPHEESPKGSQQAVILHRKNS
jgi:hypothetical protein